MNSKLQFLTGDASGLIKRVQMMDVKPEIQEEREGKKQKKEENEKTTEKCEMTVIGTVNKDKAVDVMVLTHEQKLIIGRANGELEVYESASMSCKSHSFHLFQNETDTTKTALNEQVKEKFVGAYMFENKILACTNKGNLSLITVEESEIKSVIIDLGLGSDLWVMKCHPVYPHIFATGGKEKDLCVWDVNQLTADGALECIWKAKNVSMFLFIWHAISYFNSGSK